jgi:hypothetical protein
VWVPLTLNFKETAIFGTGWPPCRDQEYDLPATNAVPYQRPADRGASDPQRFRNFGRPHALILQCADLRSLYRRRTLLYTPAALVIPSSWRSRRRLVLNSAKTPSVSRKLLLAAVLVSIGCSIALRTRAALLRVRKLRGLHRSPLLPVRQSVRMTLARNDPVLWAQSTIPLQVMDSTHSWRRSQGSAHLGSQRDRSTRAIGCQ